MSTAAPVPFTPEQLVARDPVVGRQAEHALREVVELSDLLPLLGNDPWESVPRVARMVASAGGNVVGHLYELLLQDQRDYGASVAFRFVPVGSDDRLASLLSERRGGESPFMVTRAIGEHGNPRDAVHLLDEARERKYEAGVMSDVLVALEKMLLAQENPRDAGVVFEALRTAVNEGGPAFALHPSWYVFRLRLGWLEGTIDALGEEPGARDQWSERAVSWLGLSHARRAVDVLGRIAADPAEPVGVRIEALAALAENGQEGALEAVARAGSTAPSGDSAGFAAALDAAAAQLAWQSSDPAGLARDSLQRAEEAENDVALANCLYILGRYGDSGEASSIASALLHREWKVRGAAGVALATLIGPAAEERLVPAIAEASEPIERLQLTAALARAVPERHVTGLHDALCTREVSAPWALVNPIRQAVMDAFEAAGPEGAEYREAWGEVLNMGPPKPPGKEAPPSAKAAPAAHSPPTAPPEPPPRPEPGRGTPHAQADAEAMVDRLGRTPLVDVLVGMLDDPEQGTPFTFGLFGGWGEGKSSVLRQLEARLASEDTTHRFWVAWFNAWQYERTDNLAAGLVQETVRGLVPRRRLERMALAWRFAWKRQRMRLVWALVALVLSALVSVVGIVVAATNDSVLSAIIGAGGLSVFTAVGAAVVRLYRHPIAADLWTYFRLPDYGQHLGLLPVMRDQVQALWEIRQRAGGRHRRPGRLVVVVDDLDRCSPTAIAATLDAVRLVMDMPNVVVIVALDERICLRAVAEEYAALTTPERSQGEIARDFLAKIVQLPIRLEPPDSLDDFLEHELFGVHMPQGRSGITRPGAISVGGIAIEFEGDRDRADGPGAPPGVSQDEMDAYKSAREAGGTYSAGHASAAAARLQREAMRDTTEEREEFERVARASEVHNPRQLRRLRNTYRFIKTSSASLDWRKLMVMLFWQDCLHSLSSDEFDAHEGRPDGTVPPQGISAELTKYTAEVFPDEAEFEQYRLAVVVAVLPRLDYVGAAPQP